MQPSNPNLIGIGAVFIDDIVLPDGRTHMGVLGGGVTHALMGAALWDERPGIVAVVGNNLPDEIRERFETHFDTRGLVRLDVPQMRAWQVFEHDGTRRELYRVDSVEQFTIGAQPHHFPDVYRTDAAYYLLQGFEGIRTWREMLNGFCLWEPLQQVMIPANRDAFRRVLRECSIDIVSPNLIEAQAIYGERTPAELVSALLDDGAKIVALRMGAEGSLVASAKEQHHIPAATIKSMIDQTGAGNTYCGAFLAGLIRERGLFQAGAMAAVAASFCIETIGALNPTVFDPAERDSRLLETAHL